ncbi:MAG: PQQ-binding-like beta-propeller repeat protein [Pseudomonadota bacterium]
MMKQVRITAAICALAALGACASGSGGGKRTPVLGQRIPILVAENEIVADKTLAGVQVIVPLAQMNAAWAQPGGNASKAMGHLALGEAPTRVWTARIPGNTSKERMAAAPVVADGKLFAMDTDGAVHAFSADDGRELWQFETVKDKENKGARFGGGASFDGGRVFATNGLGDVVALNAEDGAEVWRARPGGPLRGSPTIANGNVYVVSQDNQLFALNQQTGEVLWFKAATLESQGVFGVAAPASAQGTVVAGFSSGELNSYRYENGQSLWSDTLSRTSISTAVSSLSDIDAEPVIDQGRVYAVGQGGRMVAMELTSGTRLWEQNLASISTPWVAGEWVFLVTDDAKLFCLARGSGKIRWISQLPHYRNEKKKKNPISWVGPVLAGGRLILGNSEGEIVSVAPADGSVIGKIDLKEKISLTPIVANNMLFVLDEKGRITAFR